MMKSRSSEEQSGARALESAAEQAMGSSAGREKKGLRLLRGTVPGVTVWRLVLACKENG